MNELSELDYLRKISSETRIIPVGPLQARQSDELMGNFREKIIGNLVALRKKQIDPRARDELILQGISPEKYPIGYCRWIRNAVFDIVKTIPENLCQEGVNFPHLSFRKIWVIQHEKCMQNAIQAGSWIIDVANDTCDRNKPPVVIERVEDSGMRNPRNHADFCTVIEKYWGAQCYPNIYYPTLSPFFPVIFSSQGITGFYSGQTDALDAGGIFNEFDSAYQFIFDSQYSEKRLADKQIENLRQIGNHSPTVGSPSLRDIRSAFSLARRYGPNRLAEIYMGSLADVRKSTMELRV